MALALKTWTQICLGTGSGFASGAALASVVSTPIKPGGTSIAIITAWNGLIIDQDKKRLVLCANGGHGDSWNNDIYACELNVDVPYWRRLADTSPLSAYAGNPPNAPAPGNFAADNFGRCASMHTANTQVYGDGKIWTMAQSAYADQGSSLNCVFSYNLRDAALVAANAGSNPLAFANTSGPWAYHGKASTGQNASFQLGIWDKVGHRAYGFGTGIGNNVTGLWSVGTYSPGTTVVANYPTFSDLTNYSDFNSNNYQSGCGICAYDLRLLVIVDNWGTLKTITISPTGVLGTPTQVTVTGPWQVSGNQFNGSNGTMGCVYHRASSSLLLYNYNNALCANGVIIKIKIPRNVNGSYNAAANWVSSSISPAVPAALAPEGALSGGTYSKFSLVENMGNGQGLLVVCHGMSGGYTWVYKLPATELL